MRNLPAKEGVLHKSRLRWWLECENSGWKKQGSVARLGKVMLGGGFLVAPTKWDR